ncbi:hypothetical protein OEZ85_002343 [Tetradesmus obliquus]|uniref:Reverse transcriptase domain-containing protein n=1 Tax=Tetradesmus obliquus TaxID=3088 RepID=A0ABY8U7T3_TETOB|nr:hypothetical protein OEZ85_002343 [Tetradesmus obliquus]
MKRGICAVPMCTRLAVVRAVRYVDEVVISIDTDRTVCATLDMLCQRTGPNRPTHFANSGDRSSDEVPESVVCHRHGIIMQDLPGAKVNSSSDMIRHIIDNQHALRWKMLGDTLAKLQAAADCGTERKATLAFIKQQLLESVVLADLPVPYEQVLSDLDYMVNDTEGIDDTWQEVMACTSGHPLPQPRS